MEYNEAVRRITAARAGQRYGTYSQAKTKNSLMNLLGRHYKRKGQSISPEDLMELVEFLDGDIREHYGRELTYSETELAIEWGIRGEYGEFTGLNADRLFRFVRSYSESPERQEAVRREVSDRKKEPDNTGNNGRRNWYAMRSRTFQFLDEFRGHGRLSCTSTPGLYEDTGDYLATVTRMCAASCYDWLKSAGLVARDSGTMEREVETERDAVRKFGAGMKAKGFAGAVMLEGYLKTVVGSGYDLKAAVTSIPEDERNFYG